MCSLVSSPAIVEGFGFCWAHWLPFRVVFDGVTVFRVASGGGRLTRSISLSLARLAALVVLSPALLRFQRAVRLARLAPTKSATSP